MSYWFRSMSRRHARVAFPCAVLGLCLAGAVHADPLVRQFYFVDDPASWQSLTRNYESITLISPVWFTVNRSGALESTVDLKLIEWAAARNIAVVPVLVNR